MVWARVAQAEGTTDRLPDQPPMAVQALAGEIQLDAMHSYFVGEGVFLNKSGTIVFAQRLQTCEAENKSLKTDLESRADGVSMKTVLVVIATALALGFGAAKLTK